MIYNALKSLLMSTRNLSRSRIATTKGQKFSADQEIPAPGAPSKGLRILRSRADQDALHLVLEGIGGRSYALSVRTPHQLGEVSGATVETGANSATRLLVAFDGPTDTYVRRELTIPLRRRKDEVRQGYRDSHRAPRDCNQGDFTQRRKGGKAREEEYRLRLCVFATFASLRVILASKGTLQ